MENLRATFERLGYAGPIGIFSPAKAHEVLQQLRAAPKSTEWFKGRAASSREWREIGSHPDIVSRVTSILGPDVMLWGASLVKRQPGQVHPWHTDIETSDPEPGTVSVWIGLKNTTKKSALKLISRTHQIGHSIQERAAHESVQREDVTEQQALAWATESDPDAELIQPEMQDGDALFFDGRLWHGSHNEMESDPRVALLLQYAVPQRSMRMADMSVLDYPFRFIDDPRPACVMVSGHDRFGVNKLADVLPADES